MQISVLLTRGTSPQMLVNTVAIYGYGFCIRIYDNYYICVGWAMRPPSHLDVFTTFAYNMMTRIVIIKYYQLKSTTEYNYRLDL